MREEILRINIRRMADFYRFDAVAELESYESGEREFAASELNRLVQFFFVNPAFLRGESNRVLRDIVADLELSVADLLAQQFQLFLLASPSGEPDGLVYPVFYKVDSGFIRCVRGRLSSLSDESGGGAGNVYQLISHLLDQGYSSDDVRVLRTPAIAWTRLFQGTFYMDSDTFPRFGINHSYQQVFSRWFEETRNSRRQKS